MLAITGANGHLGLRLAKASGGQSLHAVSAAGAPAVPRTAEPVRALVRSHSAADAARRALPGEVEVRVVDYHDADDLTKALEGCAGVIHLVGILKESAVSRYQDAHEGTCQVLARAAARAGVQRIVYLSVVGAAADSGNACLVSKAAAETLLLHAPVPATIIRLPMVLGEGDFASGALAARARRCWNVVLRGASLEQPIYAGDVAAAVAAALARDRGARVYDLAGPESLSRTDLIRRAARVLGRRTRVLSVPAWFGMAVAAILETLSTNPPVTRAMLGVLDRDDQVEVRPALDALGLTLTPLDETLERCLDAQGAPP